MKRFFVISLFIICLVNILPAQEHRRYALIWHDEFNEGTLDESVWSKVKRSRSNWAVHMSSDKALYDFEDGNLVLRGMVNDFLPNDTAPFLTGGVWGKGKKTFGFGKVEVKAKFDVAQGFWPAIWMLPWTNHTVNWPYAGEIDIMEHFRDNSFVNQTVHTHYTYNLRRSSRPRKASYPYYKEGEYNTYAMERFQDSLVFFVNGKRTHYYPRFCGGADGQFPFSEYDYYLILDAQLGHDGSSAIDTASLPVEMRVDYVRYYELDTKTDVIPEPKDFQQLGNRKFRYRKTVVIKKEVFDNPDEYHIVIKRGRAKVSGNVIWAQSTLEQLIDEQGQIANLEIHDKPTCPFRGISLDKYAEEVTYNKISKLLEVMASLKLNYLQWNGKGSCSEEEVDVLREYARGLGVTMLTGGISTITQADFIDFEDNSKFPASSRVFLHTASNNGGWFYLKGMGTNDMEALMAFAERYWRGGDAGEGTVEKRLPEPLSTAGTRLANFKEKTAIHQQRFGDK